MSIGDKDGKASGLRFRVARCPECRFVFIADPWVDFDEIYDDAYYAGRGADPLVNYVSEVAHPDTTIRRYEWRGIVERVGGLVRLDAGTRWLDYGCGTGGLVTYLRGRGIDAVGSEQGESLERLTKRGIPVLEDLDASRGGFGVVTAIEVIEHVLDPVAELRRIRALLRPGGLLFLTTGNARPHADGLLGWRYLVPEIHVSLFEPGNLALALRRAGFAVEFPGWGPGWVDIIRFKALKNLGRRRVAGWERAVPWPVVTRILDWRLRLSAHPVGWASADADGGG